MEARLRPRHAERASRLSRCVATWIRAAPLLGLGDSALVKLEVEAAAAAAACCDEGSRVAMTTIDGDDEEGRGQVREVKGGVTVTVMSGLGKRPTFGGGGALSRIRNAALRRPCESDARAQHACGTVALQAQQMTDRCMGGSGGGKPDIPRFEGLARQRATHYSLLSTLLSRGPHSRAKPLWRLPAKIKIWGRLEPSAARKRACAARFFPPRPFWRSESVPAAGCCCSRWVAFQAA
ncbi:hypothetical protein L1887_55773 [Cichorium endivia]|nr:hypothetical protein L1887_55773 [Cichorium endivia]